MSDDRSELDAAIEAAKEQPENESAWDDVEALAGTLDLPDDVAALYREVLASDLSPDLAELLGQRAAQFYEEWFGDDPSGLADVLTRVLALNPKSSWAFQQLTVVLTVAARWDDLLALYDRTIESAEDKSRKITLLEEAAQVARDLADKSDRAIGYLQQLLPLKADDSKLAQSLERLLEKHERWADLIDLWQTRLESLPSDERVSTLGRIAACWLDNLADAANALEAGRKFLEEASDDSEATALLERIVNHAEASGDVRDGALDQLRWHYESSDRQREIVRVLEGAIEADPSRALELRQEAAQLLAELGDLEAAMGHYAAVLALEPESAATLGHLRQLAQRSGNYSALAEGCRRGADAANDPSRKVFLLSTAAKTSQNELSDEAAAIELYSAALAVEGIQSADVLTVGRRLNELLSRANRPAERLQVLERLAAAETVESTRKALIGDIARLAESLGNAEHALNAWRARLDLDPSDRIALDGIINLLEREQQWEPLVVTLKQRVQNASSKAERRADLVRIAQVYQDELGATSEALEIWTTVQTNFGENRETVAALTGLLSSAERWSDLAELLERATVRESTDLIERLVHLGDAYREHLESPGRALDCYDRILRIDPNNEGARDGMRALLDNAELGEKAAEFLSSNCQVTGDWQGVLSLVETRLGAAETLNQKLDILREAARLHENNGQNFESAQEALTQAFLLSPRDRVLEDELRRVTAQTGKWSELSEVYGQALEAVAGDNDATSGLRCRRGALRETHLDELDGALVDYQAAASLEPDNRETVVAVLRVAGQLAQWQSIASTFLTYTQLRDKIDGELWDAIEAATAEKNGWSDCSDALGETLATCELAVRHAAEILWRIAGWESDKIGDPERTERSLVRVVDLEPSRREALQALAAIQRQSPGPQLFLTLQRLVAVEPNNLDLFSEVARVATEHVESQSDVEATLTTLLGRASAAWKGTAPAQSSEPPELAVTWSIERMVERYTASGRANLALDLLVDSSRLPFDAATKRVMRNRAATIAAEHLGDTASAIEMYRSIISLTPDDHEALEKLGALYRQEGKLAELLSLCQHELSLNPDGERRLVLRLEVAKLVGEIEQQSGRVEALTQNLAEVPGHPESIEALTRILGEQNRHGELLNLVTSEANKLEALEQTEKAADLWTQAAELAETKTEQPMRAIEAYRRVVAIRPVADAFDSLSRLYADRDEPGQAVPWLERLLDVTDEDHRTAVVLRLARAHVGDGADDAAVSVLASALAGGNVDSEIRSMLADLYRSSDRWEPLAELLSQTLEHLEDPEAIVSIATEAAEIYHQHLDAPEKAVPALNSALAVRPDDRDLRVMLARSMRAANDLEGARTLLEELIGEFGRRRSKERAQIHVELALVHKSEGNHDKALAEAELASRMDVGNPHLLRQTAALAMDGGFLDKAEKSLRALLLVVRRQPPGDDEQGVGESEVLYDLHRIAASHGDDDKAGELLDSALEASCQSDAEVRRLRRTLLLRNEYDVLLKALENRLGASDNDDSKSHLLSDIADVLAAHKDQPQEALTRRIEALNLKPARIALHDKTAQLATQIGRLDKYLDAVSSQVEELRRGNEAELSGTLLMRLGTLSENEVGDLKRARDFYKRAEETGHSTADALFSLARVCGELGDAEEATRALDQLSSMATDQEPSPAQATALYRLAEMQVANAELRQRGIEMLTQALSVDPRHRKAAAILRTAAEAEPENMQTMQLYGQVARASGEWPILLDYLERRAQLPAASPEQIKEAVDLAVAHDEPARGEALLARAVDAGRNSDDGLASALWAVTALIEQKVGSGELGGAAELLFEAANVADPEDVQTLGLAISNQAIEDARDLELASRTLEFLRDRDPQVREIWEPLVDIYRRQGQRDHLLALVASTLPTLMDPAERNALRVQNARFLIDSGEPTDATEILRDALLDNPDDLEAAALFEEVLRQTGDREGLADFLWQRFDDAKERRNPQSLADVAVRLGGLLGEYDAEQAIGVYRTALELAPHDIPVLYALLALLTEEENLLERAGLTERLLAVEEEDKVPEIADGLTRLWSQLGDHDGILRALQIGHKRAPGDEGLRRRLESHYHEAGMWNELAEMMTAEACRLEDQSLAVARFRQAASIYREQLENPSAAARVLAQAREVAPSDSALVIELAKCLQLANDLAGAADALAAALDGDFDDDARVEFLDLRAHLLSQLGRPNEAVSALDQAYELAPQQIGPILKHALGTKRETAIGTGDRQSEREATLRLAELCGANGEGEVASDLLVGWVTSEPLDREALIQLRDLDTDAERWHGVVAACSRLVSVEEGQDQLDAAVRLAQAAHAMGDIGQARSGLEYVHHVQREADEVRAYLRKIYEGYNAFRELAGVLMVDAEFADNDDARYENFRRAADLLVTQLGDAEAAIAPAQQAQALRPDDHDTVVLNADVLTASGQIQEAAAILEPAIAAHKRRSPELAALQLRMSRIAAAAGDMETQLGWLKKAFDVDRKNGVIAAELAHLATQMQDYDLALKPLRAISLMDSPGPISRVMALLWEAKIEHARGNRAKAELWAKKALREDPEFAEAQEFLAEIGD